MTNRAAPPGSMRYFSLLYAPPAKRDSLLALFVIDAEIRESAQSPNHDVAHTRLRWWRDEVERLANGNPQHPATRVLAASTRGGLAHYRKLHELLAAADMDLARLTYLNMQEVRAYSSRSGGAVLELAAHALIESGAPDETARSIANRLGAGVRQTEILRDVRQDTHEGRLYLPLDALERAGIGIEELRGRQFDDRARTMLAEFRAAIAAAFTQSVAALPPATRRELRPLLVLAALHERLLDRIARLNFDVASQRIELGPIEKPWTAWRAARRSG